MSQKPQNNEDFRGKGTYEIRINGHLHDRWADAFNYMQMTREDDGTTTLKGVLPDQTALHSILLVIRNLNLTLISVSKKNAFEE